MELTRLMRLLQFADSALPVGAFAFSNTLETAVEQHIVEDEMSLAIFVEELMRQSAASDGIAGLEALRATAQRNYDALLTIDNRLMRSKLNDEARKMSYRCGRKLAELGAQIISEPILAEWLEDIATQRTAGSYAATQGILFSISGLSERALFATMQYGVMTTTLNAALRCMRITHLQTQQIIRSLGELTEQLFEQVRELHIDDINSFFPMLDTLGSLHERGTSRMFMN